MKISYKVVAFLIIFLYVSFSQTAIQKAEGKEISKEEVVGYIKQGYEVVDATDEILETLLDETYQGIPYFEWIKALMAIDKAYFHIQYERYGYVVKDIIDATLPSVLKELGYVSIGTVVSSALRIYDSLAAFNEAVTQSAFNQQVKNYFRYRDEGNTHEEIIAPNFLFRTDDGWLLPITYVGGAPRPLKPEHQSKSMNMPAGYMN